MRFKLSSRVLFHQCLHYSTTTESVGLFNNRSLNVCLFGHHQSGKTSICSTITKLLSKVNSTRYVPIDSLDSMDEEKSLKSNINLSFAPINTGNTRVTLIDSPGRDDLVSTKIRGLTLADIGVLVVSNDQNNLVDTINHELVLAKHFNLKNIVLLLNDKQSTISGKETTIEGEKIQQIRSLLKEYNYNNNLIVTGKTLEQLIQYIDQHLLPQRNRECPLLLKVVQAKVFSRNDAYILGYLDKGSLEAGQNVTVIGKGREFEMNVSKIVSSPKGCEKVEAGQLCELMLRGKCCKWIIRGMVLTKPGCYHALDHLECLVKPLQQNRDHNFEEIIKTVEPLTSLYSDQIVTKCFIEELKYYQEPRDICDSQSKYLYKCNLKLGHSLILFNQQPIAFSKDKKLIALGQVDQSLPDLNADEKIDLFLRLKKT